MSQKRKQKKNNKIVEVQAAEPEIIAPERASGWLANLRSTDGAILFNPSILKFVVMSLSTGGLYSFLWMYKNWCYIKTVRDQKVSPFLRTFFFPFWMTALFRDMNTVCGRPGLLDKFFAANLSFIFLFLMVCVIQVPPFNLISKLTFLPLIVYQVMVNKTNAAAGKAADNRFTMVNWLIIVVIGFINFIGILHAFGLRAHRH